MTADTVNKCFIEFKEHIIRVYIWDEHSQISFYSMFEGKKNCLNYKISLIHIRLKKWFLNLKKASFDSKKCFLFSKNTSLRKFSLILLHVEKKYFLN